MWKFIQINEVKKYGNNQQFNPKKIVDVINS